MAKAPVLMRKPWLACKSICQYVNIHVHVCISLGRFVYIIATSEEAYSMCLNNYFLPFALKTSADQVHDTLIHIKYINVCSTAFQGIQSTSSNTLIFKVVIILITISQDYYQISSSLHFLHHLMALNEI